MPARICQFPLVYILYRVHVYIHICWFGCDEDDDDDGDDGDVLHLFHNTILPTHKHTITDSIVRAPFPPSGGIFRRGDVMYKEYLYMNGVNAMH